MKTLLSALFGLCLASIAFGQSASDIGTPKRSPDDLRKLLAPIALYPDALVALILPSSTDSADLVLAARFFAAQGDPQEIEKQPWDESVKSLARYPEVIKWMDENLTWTKEVGEAFAAQPADLMNTIQALRSEAQSDGALRDTPQQRVFVRDQQVCIVPAQDDVVYVPYYDPEILLARRRVSDTSWISFGFGFAAGSWLNYDCDWRTREVIIRGRQPGWRYRPDWRWHPRDPLVPVVYHPWRPSPRYLHYVHDEPRHDYHPVPIIHLHPDVEDHNHARVEGQRRGNDHPEVRHDDQRTWVRAGENQAVQPRRPYNEYHRAPSNDVSGSNLPVHQTATQPPPAPETRGNGDARRGTLPPPVVGGQVGRVDRATAPAAPTVPPAAPSGPPTAGTQNWRQIQEHSVTHPVDAGNQRTFPHQVNDSPVHRAEPTSDTRSVPVSPAPQHVRAYERHEVSSAPASAARQVAPQPAAAAPAPAAAHRGDPPAEAVPGSANDGNAAPAPAPAQSREGPRDPHRVFR